MKTANPLTLEFLTCYPSEAARSLELVSAADVAALFTELPVKDVVPVLTAMLPEAASTTLALLESPLSAKLLTEVPIEQAARIYALLAPEKQTRLDEALSTKRRRRLRSLLDYESLRAGDLMYPEVNMLPLGLSVSDALRRVKRFVYPVRNEIYIVDDAHCLKGFILAGSLLSANSKATLKEMMSRQTHAISVTTGADQLLSLPAWEMHRDLPVVGKDNVLLGVLELTRLKASTGENPVARQDGLVGLLSLTGLYWLTLAKLLEGLLSNERTQKEEVR